jgi:hypothetical protein
MYSLGLSSSVRSSSVVAWAVVATPRSKDVANSKNIITLLAISVFGKTKSSDAVQTGVYDD